MIENRITFVQVGRGGGSSALLYVSFITIAVLLSASQQQQRDNTSTSSSGTWRIPFLVNAFSVPTAAKMKRHTCCDRSIFAATATSGTNQEPLGMSSSSESTESASDRRRRNIRFRRNSNKNNAIAANAIAATGVPPLNRNPPRKVCLMVEPTPFTHVSGYANRFQEMLKYMKQAGDNVDILTVDSKTKTRDLPTHFIGYKIHHTQGFTFPLYNHISLTLDLPEMIGARIIDTFKPDIIHVTSPGFLLFAALFYARVMKIPLVMSYHTHLPTYGKNYLGFIPRVEQTCWDLLRYAHSRADLTLVTSPQMKEELIKNGIPRVDVWRKGIDTVRFHPQFQSDAMRAKMTNGNPDDFLMVYVGRLGAEKRLKDLLPVIQKIPNGRLCFVGNGPQKEELQSYFAGTNTVFTGQLQGDELSASFASADVFVMPSDSETLGFVVLESMASGVPVVGAAAGGILDLIHDGKDGYLVETGNTEMYVTKLLQLAKDTTLRQTMGKNARMEAEKWGWEAATSYLRNVQYEKALINFHSRAFGGFGRPGTAGVWRLFKYRVQGIMRRYFGRRTEDDAETDRDSTNNAIVEPRHSFLSFWRRRIQVKILHFFQRLRSSSLV